MQQKREQLKKKKRGGEGCNDIELNYITSQLTIDYISNQQGRKKTSDQIKMIKKKIR